MSQRDLELSRSIVEKHKEYIEKRIAQEKFRADEVWTEFEKLHSEIQLCHKKIETLQEQIYYAEITHEADQKEIREKDKKINCLSLAKESLLVAIGFLRKIRYTNSHNKQLVSESIVVEEAISTTLSEPLSLPHHKLDVRY